VQTTSSTGGFDLKYNGFGFIKNVKVTFLFYFTERLLLLPG